MLRIISLIRISALLAVLCLASVRAFPQERPTEGNPADEKASTQTDTAGAGAQASGGERLSSKEVSELPLNKRDFSQLLLLAAGTMTDANGAANFTQQFAVNGQRGTTTVFAMDGVDTTDPEMGGATFSNFNVDTIQEIQANSGVMPAEIGHGAASFTNIVTKSGTDLVHGSAFEFVRNAAFDARNFFDRRSLASPGRIPPFVRNEFGFTIGGPLVFPGLYNGRRRTYFFGQYQGFRQVLGTTQVFPVPTAEEKQGVDRTAFPGDVLSVPVSAAVAPILARYPLPNDPQGAFGARTYATSSKVSTVTDQFSIRIDHRISDKAVLFARFNLNHVTGPLTNPSQTAIDPGFAVRFSDHQRNAGLRYTRTVSPRFVFETTLGYMRSTPNFRTNNHTQPSIAFGDGLYEPFNSAAGSVFGSYGNLFQIAQNFTYTRGKHRLKMGWEGRANRDTTFFGVKPNGAYRFGGGAAYAQVEIPSASGQHDIHVGDLLPDGLSGFLTATPETFGITVASPLVAQGDRFAEGAIRRDAVNFYFQDTWAVSPRLVVAYGLRYEVNGRIYEGALRTQALLFVGPDGREVPSLEPGARAKLVVHPQPTYVKDWHGLGPRLSIEWRATPRTVLRAGGSVATILPNLWQDNFVTCGFPLLFEPNIYALPDTPVPFENSVAHVTLPTVYTPQGQAIYSSGRTTDVAPNTEVDLQRFQDDVAAGTPGHQVQPLSIFGVARDFRNGYIASYTAGLERDFGGIKVGASYVATMGVRLASMFSPNSYGGADAAFAPFTKYDSAGQVIGGLGSSVLMTTRSHSTYHALQTSATKELSNAGLGFQASYTFSKALDDTSSVLGGYLGQAGTVLQAQPQNPWDLRAEKGPATFDVAHVFTLSLFQALPFDRVGALRPLGKKLTSGWQILNITTLMSGSPFSVFSGVQQTGAGQGGGDRPDQIAQPVLSTGRKIREDYFGQGADNAAFFYIPIGIPGGTGPKSGRFGTLGRDTFRGPGFRNFDVAIIKETAFGQRGGAEALTIQFRAELFNVFNLVNFGLPSNIVRGSGFGIINRTAGPSRQIQLSLKLIF